jgi:tetratricopeptide (TPR) repeat protein
MSAGRLEEVAALLGSHFAAAGEAQRAVAYFEMAGDHAVGSFANDEAVSTFRSALAIVDGDRSGSEVMARAAVDLRAKLANVLWRTWRRGEAREAFNAAIRLGGSGDALQRAHLQTRLGRLEIADRHYDAAAAAFDAAEALLGEHPEDQAWADQWLEVMVDGRALLHLERNEPELALAVLAAALGGGRPASRLPTSSLPCSEPCRTAGASTRRTSPICAGERQRQHKVVTRKKSAMPPFSSAGS